MVLIMMLKHMIKTGSPFKTTVDLSKLKLKSN